MAVAQHRVQHGNHLSHTGGQGDFLVFAGGDHVAVHGFELRVALDRGHHSHEQYGAYACATTADAATSSERPAVAVEGCESGESGYLLVGQSAELR